MNKYKAFYKGKSTEIEAPTSYRAQRQAAEYFRARQAFQVTVVLAERNEKPITHLPLD